MPHVWRILLAMGHLHRIAPFALLTLVSCVLFWTPLLIVAIGYGIIAQFFVEYVMHRFLYHREPPTAQSPFNALYRSHISHHEFPNDPEYFTGDDLWFPVRFGLLSGAVHTLILAPFLGLPTALLVSSAAIFIGSASAFAFYEFCHTIAHLKVEKGWLARQVTRSHLKHHFNDHETVFHVSFGMGWIDRLFGTEYDRDDAQSRFDPETILSMGMDPEDLRLVTARKAFGITKTPRRRSA